MQNILTIEEVRTSLRLDGDYPTEELNELSVLATSFVYQMTNFTLPLKTSNQNEILPLVKQLCKLFLKQNYYGKSGYDIEQSMDYTIGINGLIEVIKNYVQFN